MYQTNYHRASSIDDAAAQFAKGTEAKYLAGGQTLLPVMKQRLAAPSDVIDLSKIASMIGIEGGGDAVTIKGATPHYDVANSADVARAIPALARLAGMIGDPAVRNRGTLGGSISNNDPAADYPGACLALGATIRTTKREIKADDFFTGMFETALEPDEIVKAVHFPKADKAAYEKFRNPASRYAMVGSFVAKAGNTVKVAITGAGQGGAYRWTAAEQALASNGSASAIDGLTVSPDDLNSDIHASSEYRAHLVKVITKRALAKAR